MKLRSRRPVVVLATVAAVLVAGAAVGVVPSVAATTTTKKSATTSTKAATTVKKAAVTASTPTGTTPSTLSGVAPIANRTSTGVTDDALPTVQIDGVVWTQVVSGTTVYAGGSFANARPAGAAAGTNLTPRNNLLAYDITTGNLITSFNPNLNGQVKALALSPNGQTLYVGGSFTTAGGLNRYRLAAYSTATGALLTTFAPTLDASVNAIAATNSTVYVGGGFSNANGNARTKLAAFSASNGALLGWAPSANNLVDSMTMTPDGTEVIVGGAFSAIGSTTAQGVTALDATTGAVLPYAINTVQTDGDAQSAILSLTTDGTNVYGTGYSYGTGNFEGTFSVSPDTGTINWLEDCHGDSYDAFATGQQVYVVSHEHYCTDIGAFPDTNPRSRWQRTTAFTTAATGTVGANQEFCCGYGNFQGQPSPSQISWYPTLAIGTYTKQNQAAWSVSGNNQYVVEGGEFPTVNGVAQQGLVRFAIPSVNADKTGPSVTDSSIVPTATSTAPNTATVTWQTNADNDDRDLTYTVYRSPGPSTPIYTTTASSEFWQRPYDSYQDSGLTAGTTYTYWLRETDPSGNTLRTNDVTVTTPGTGSTAAAVPTSDKYSAAVYSAAPSLFWPLSDSGSTATDLSANGQSGTYSGSYTQGTASPVTGTSATATTFAGGGSVSATTSVAGPSAYSEQVWFKTTSTSGGELMGFGQSTGNSRTVDRTVSMNSSGQLVFANNQGSNTITTPASYNDGNWHEVTATLGGDGARVYVDGILVASTMTTSVSTFSGYWKVGGDNNSYFSGALADYSVYPYEMTQPQVVGQLTLSPASSYYSAPPKASFTSTCTNLTCSFDATSSTATNATITGYAWTFGDNSTGTGSTTNHTYPAAATYPVTLTVTDSNGNSSSVTNSVSPTAPVNTPTTYVSDAFGRTVASGWGSADVGGAYSLSGGVSNFAVGNGTGTMTLASAAAQVQAALPSQSVTNSVQTVDVGLNQVTTGNGLNFTLRSRVSGSSDYDMKVRFLPGGVVHLAFAIGGGATLKEIAIPSLTYAAGTMLRAQFTVSGNGTSTNLSGSVWAVGQTAPTSPQLTLSDSTASLQGAGSVALQAYLAGNSTSAPVAVTVDNYSVTSAS